MDLKNMWYKCKRECKEGCVDTLALCSKHKGKVALLVVVAMLVGCLVKPVWVGLHCFWYSL